MDSNRSFRLLIITGLSGSGKTSVVHALEDEGFFCVDNLPVLLLPGLLDLCQESDTGIQQLAAVMDVRERGFLVEYPGIFQKVRERGTRPEILFLDATTDALLRRFEETGRPHPLAENGTLLEGIERERTRLFGLKQLADRVVDTSLLNVHQIRKYVSCLYGKTEQRGKRLQVELLSFGYAKGIPLHMSLVMDVRFLPNPHYDPQLRRRDGRDPEVQAAVRTDPKATEILDQFFQWLESVVGFSEKEDRAYFTLGIGCTGGRHRSVAVVCMLEARLRALGYSPRVYHRDL